MRWIIWKLLIICVTLSFIGGVATAFPPATPIDLTNGGMEILGPDTMRLHNVLVNGQYQYCDFQWNAKKCFWYLSGIGLEETSFDTSEYYPMKDGSSWTYASSVGGTLTLNVNGTEEICGAPAILMESSDGTRIYWIDDDSGVFTVKYVFPDGVYNEWCPPMQMAPAQGYVGFHSLYPFFGAILGSPYGPFGTLDGWTTCVVSGVEDVTTPGGFFPDCIHMTVTLSSKQTSGGSFRTMRTEDTWYARDIGMVKRVNTMTVWLGGMLYTLSGDVQELLNYSIPE